MPTVTIEEAQKKLSELIHRLTPGEEVVIHRETISPSLDWSAPHPRRASPAQLGTLRGTVLSMAPDFDAPLDDFKEYME